MKRRRIVLYGHFGSGNVGNDSTLEAVLPYLGQYRPDAEVCCVCADPAEIRHRLGLDTVPLSVKRRTPSRGRSSSRTSQMLSRAVAEARWCRRTLPWLRSVDRFIIVGTGAVDDMATRPWNAPLDLFKWCHAARLAGARVTFLAVGVGPIEHPISRRLMLSALRSADYRSYRDVESLEFVERAGLCCDRDQLSPDLVFGLPPHRGGRAAATPPNVVGLGLIGYYGWRHDPRSGESIYQHYLVKICGFVDWLLQAGYSIRLLAGDRVDARPIEDVLTFVTTAGRPEWAGRVAAEPIVTGRDLFRELDKTDIVVATRFHNVVSGLIAGRRVLSIGYHPKNAAVLADVGLASFCEDIDRFQVPRLIERFKSLLDVPASFADDVASRCEEFRRRLDDQYRGVFSSAADTLR